MYRLLIAFCLIQISCAGMALRPAQPQNRWDELINDFHEIFAKRDSTLMAAPYAQIKSRLNLRLDTVFGYINECEAMREYEQLDTMTATPRQLTLTALRLYNTDEHDRALPLFEKAAAGGNIQAANMAALIYLDREDIDSAVDCFQHALTNIEGKRLYMPIYHNLAYFMSIMSPNLEDADIRKEHLKMVESFYTLYLYARDLSLPKNREMKHIHYSPLEFISARYAENDEELDYILSGEMLKNAIERFRASENN